MTKRELERLENLLVQFFEEIPTSNGSLRDRISLVRFEVQLRLESQARLERAGS